MKFAVGTKTEYGWGKRGGGCHVVVVLLLLENEEASPASMILGVVNNIPYKYFSK